MSGTKKRYTRTIFGTTAVLLAAWLALAPAAEEPKGQAALELALRRLPVTATLLHTAAHPDDEDTALLAYLARGRGVRAAYLSATRGEGGQNLLGREQYEALGLLRTEELLAARRLDGAEQFFARAYDFGYSRDAAEALSKWGHERTLSDFVRVIRRLRPDVVVSRFSGGPQDGHGQHAAAGVLAREAFRAAADPQRFAEQAHEGLAPWQAKKLYVSVNRFGPAAGQPPPEGALEIELGDYDPVLGRSYAELAMAGRSLHRSQAMGAPQRKGSHRQAFVLADTALPRNPKERDLFDGLETRLPAGPLLEQIEKARAALDSRKTPELAAALARGLELARELPGGLRERKEGEFRNALVLAHGLALEALAAQHELTPGEPAQINVTLWNRSAVPIEVHSIELAAPKTWNVEGAPAASTMLSYNRSLARAFRISPPADAAPSQPFWLQLPRRGDSYEVADPSLIGAPHDPPLLEARARIRSGGVDFALSAPAVSRHVDQIYGQRDRPVVLVPPLAAWIEPGLSVFPPGAEREVTARLRRNIKQQPPNDSLELTVSSGWSANPSRLPIPVGIQEGTQKVRLRATGTPPSRPDGTGDKKGSARLTLAGKPLNGYHVIDYPHIQPRYWFRPAEARLAPIEARIPQGLKAGYIMGAGDDVPEALRQLGASVELLAGSDLLAGDLARFDAIVTGIRAYAVRDDLVAANSRLLDYVRHGGVLIVQYNSEWPGRESDVGLFPFAPYPMRQARRAPRVADEEQPVTILAPEHPLLASPNRITAADFEGWVQERGLYFMSEWAPEYTPLLASADPGDPPQKGGMLAARFGKGLYVYTAYSWFRQLPAGVPGAYRIWANLLSARRR